MSQRIEAIYDTINPLGIADSAGNIITLPSAEEIQKGIRPVTVGLQELKGFIETKCEKKHRSEDDAEVFKSMVRKVREAVMKLIATFQNVSFVFKGS